MSSKAITRVTVLNGGPSVEREVSLVSGSEIASALRGEGYIVSIIDADQNLASEIIASDPMLFLMLCMVGGVKMVVCKGYLNGCKFHIPILGFIHQHLPWIKKKQKIFIDQSDCL